MNRTQLINSLIKDYGFKSYLEIGLGKGTNFNQIKVDFKIGVDPKSDSIPIKSGITKPQDSDTFFEWGLKECNDDSSNKVDLIFIDGNHTAEQVERDIVNAWNCLNKGGLILLHDINPPTKKSQEVPKVSSPWKGTV
jgi:hypothetical protein